MGTVPQEAELKQQARRLGLANVSFLGALPESDKVALYKLCHAFVFPSHIRSEAFGVALVEAAMHGKPMISCEIGPGTTFINLDKVTGIRSEEHKSELQSLMRISYAILCLKK